MVRPKPQLSVAPTSSIFCGGTSAAHCTVTSIGQTIVGGIISFTTITWVQVAELPHKSVALYTLTTVNLLIQPILVIWSSTWVTIMVGEQLSVPMTSPVLSSGTSFQQPTVILGGHWMTGGVESSLNIV